LILLTGSGIAARLGILLTLGAGDRVTMAHLVLDECPHSEQEGNADQ
jgi:hypothetical protein